MKIKHAEIKKHCLIKLFKMLLWQRASNMHSFAGGWAEETCFSQLAVEMHGGNYEWDTHIDLAVVGSKKNVYY